MEFNIKLTLYFEIKDSEIYGGVGSVGYLSEGIELNRIDYEKDNLFNKRELMERYISEQTKAMAEFVKVPIERVRVISKEEYDSNTDDDYWRYMEVLFRIF